MGGVILRVAVDGMGSRLEKDRSSSGRKEAICYGFWKLVGSVISCCSMKSSVRKSQSKKIIEELPDNFRIQIIGRELGVNVTKCLALQTVYVSRCDILFGKITFTLGIAGIKKLGGSFFVLGVGYEFLPFQLAPLGPYGLA